MRQKVLIEIIIIFLFLFILPSYAKVLAAALQFEPTSIKTDPNRTFEIKIVVEAGSDQITSVDAYILYDQNLLEAQNLIKGTFFPTINNNLSQTGRAYISGIVDKSTDNKTDKGTLATLVFLAKKAGSGTLTFDCKEGSTTDSNIIKNDANATDIISCSSNSNANFVIGSNATNPSPTISELPRSGVTDNLVVIIFSGSSLIITGSLIRILFVKY